MLVALTVRNIVLIEQLTLELDAGFNVLTGETGLGGGGAAEGLFFSTFFSGFFSGFLGCFAVVLARIV